MEDRRFRITQQQWERFVTTVGPTLGELLAAGVLNEAADEVVLSGGRTNDDLRCRVDGRTFTVEVKTTWWHDGARTVLGHSPLRGNQRPDLVAFYGAFDAAGDSRTVRGIAADALSIRGDRFFYLVPCDVVRGHSAPDGRSRGRALIAESVVEPYAIDLSTGLSRTDLLAVLALSGEHSS